jgi:hypothetical protein
MSTKPVISCPRCLRQYSIEPSVTLAQCGVCKSHFQVAIAELALPGESVTLNRPITAHFNFHYEATAQAARNVKIIFDLAAEPFTTEAVARFMKWMPRSAADLEESHWRDEYCNQVMRRACDSPNFIDKSKAQEATMFFLGHALTRDSDALDMLIAAFAGVLSVEYELPRSRELAVAQKVIAKRRWFSWPFRWSLGRHSA